MHSFLVFLQKPFFFPINSCSRKTSGSSAAKEKVALRVTCTEGLPAVPTPAQGFCSLQRPLPPQRRCLGRGRYLPAERVPSAGLLRPLPGRGQRPPQPQGPAPHPRQGSSSAGIARNAQVGTGEGAGAVTANVPVGMNDQFNSAIRAGGGECKLSNVLHSCSYSNSSPDLANRHFHL